MHRPAWVAHSLLIAGSHTTKNTASGGFVTVIHFHHSLIFSKVLEWSTFQDFSVLTRNIKLGWKLLTLTNNLAYHNIKLITQVKNFMVQVLKLLKIKEEKMTLKINIQWLLLQKIKAFTNPVT
jgi:hypothetical protein